jgi:hypothetical protein
MGSIKNEARKAIVGTILGETLVLAGALGTYFTFGRHPGKMNWWAVLTLAGIPVALWGCSNLARSRGQPTAIAYSLFVIGVFAMQIQVRGPLVVGFNLFVGVTLPVVVLLALPNKGARRGHRRYHHR